jgi:hypothetical protein
MPGEEYDVKVTVGDAQIEVRGAKDGVVEIVRALSEVLAGRASRPRGSRPEASTSEPSPARRGQVDARSFFREKAPSSQSEAISVATYYLTELAPPEMRAPAIDARGATEVFKQARYPLPKRIAQVLVNAQNAGYLVRVGSGEYKLSPVGFNLVEHTLGPNA